MTKPKSHPVQVSDEITVRRPRVGRRSTWIIVCENLHGAVGPIPTEELAIELAEHASSMGECTYRPMALAIATGHDPVAGSLAKRGTTTTWDKTTEDREARRKPDKRLDGDPADLPGDHPSA
jgi:hypothetical protein